MSKQQKRRRLSILRLFIVIIMIVVLGYISVSSLNSWQEIESVKSYDPWFAAYVDVTSKPTYAFEELGSKPTNDVILSFIVSSTSDPCTPTWGTYFTLDEAGVSLDFDRRIARLQQLGGKVAVSFGGALNDELALNCKNHNDLVSAYNLVIERYNLDTIDLDLENGVLSDSESLQRRAEVIAELQKNRRESGKNLAIWLTLPVTPTGLTQEGTNAVEQMLLAGVDLAGVNIMTMDYGESRENNQSIIEASKRALIETHRQLGILYSQSGLVLNSATLWKKIGATPMIGQNDVINEVFTLDDAIDLNKFAVDKGVGRMSMWSANRDLPCGENYVDLKIVSDSCSGVSADPFSFSQALSIEFDGDLTQNSTIITSQDPEVNFLKPDDPEKSPYQIWTEKGAYLEGTKVVWHGNVYEAKWWSKGDLPDNPVLRSWDTPWKLIGPVLPGETPVPIPTLAPGTFPDWTGSIEYETGTIVLFEGVPYRAKWWNQGQSPAAAAANADSSPWVDLTSQEVADILEQSSTTSKEILKN